MKLFVYQNDFDTVYETCIGVLKQMNFKISRSDIRTGAITAIHDEGITSLSSILDLRICIDKFSICINVISSSVSNIFGTFFQNTIAENNFFDLLFEELNAIHSTLEYSRRITDQAPVVVF
jgi:hypothetical protein